MYLLEEEASKLVGFLQSDLSQ